MFLKAKKVMKAMFVTAILCIGKILHKVLGGAGDVPGNAFCDASK